MTVFRTWQRGWAVAAMTCALAASAAGAADDARVGQLEKQVQELQREVASLRAGGDAAAEQAELERKIQVLAQEIEMLKLGEASPEPSQGIYGLGPSASKIYSVKKGVAFGGYGEMLYSAPSSTLQ